MLKVSAIRASIVSIQSAVRGSIDRIVISQLLDLMEQHQGATKIQASYRGFRDRKALKQIEALHDKATVIQANVRGHLQRKRLLENASATRIQARMRGYSCRKEMRRRHEEATKIQATFRGYKARADARCAAVRSMWYSLCCYRVK